MSIGPIGIQTVICDNRFLAEVQQIIMNFIKSAAFVLTALHVTSLQANINTYFTQIKNDPNALYSFFKIMPKGGELHYHLAGGPYPETMLELAARGEYCLDKKTLAVSKDTMNCDGVKTKDVMNQPELYSEIIKSWSMKDFVPGKESGHDHFFSGFTKYMPIILDYRPQLLVDIIKRAAQQNESYLEIMDIPDGANSSNFGDLIKNTASYDKKRQLLLANKDFQTNINHTIAESDRILDQTHQQLGCKTTPNSAPCTIKIKLLYYILREQPLDNMFSQSLNAFEAVSRSKGNLVGVNLVQPEDGIISIRDYRKQMKIFQYLHQIYPQVNTSLHAGELAPETVVPQELSYHIHDAIFIGHAKRIGHGVDIAYEDGAEATLKYMADHQLPVEINLISNLKILNVSGRAHPLNYYLSHHVPVVLSTDDEGILRTDLTRQYVEAVLGHNLNYQDLKQINRNTLIYAFIPGMSLWADVSKGQRIAECVDLHNKTCAEFIKNNERAKLQWELEQKLITFESKF